MSESVYWPYLLLIVFGFLPSVFWKFLSAFFAHGIDEKSPLLVFVRAMATCILAGVACKLVVAPAGALLLTPMWVRVAALSFGLAAWSLAGRSILVAVVIGETCLIAGAWLFSGV